MPIRARDNPTPPSDPVVAPMFAGVQVSPAGEVLPSAPAEPDTPLPVSVQLERSQKKFSLLLPTAQLDLSEKEAEVIQTYQQARMILDAAGAAPLRCSTDCPFKAGCPLERIHKAPYQQLCPFEANYVVERFVEWMREFERTEETLAASERFAIGQLVSYQIELQRVRAILADPKEASLKSISVKDVHAETLEPIAWEEVVAIAAQREDQVITGMRMLMRDFELTPEQKTKKAKALGIRRGNDSSTRQSATWAKLQPGGGKVIDLPAN